MPLVWGRKEGLRAFPNFASRHRRQLATFESVVFVVLQLERRAAAAVLVDLSFAPRGRRVSETSVTEGQ